jgi:hypothetical protein
VSLPLSKARLDSKKRAAVTAGDRIIVKTSENDDDRCWTADAFFGNVFLDW